MRLTRPAILVCLLVMASTNAIAQQGATLRISGRVSPALKLSLAAWPAAGASSNGTDSRLQVSAHEASDSVILIDLRGHGINAETPFSIPVEIRTNADYEMIAALVAADGCVPAITAQVDSVGSSGPHVRPEAVEQSVALRTPTLLDSRPIVLLNGPRVSKAGNFLTPTNALRAGLIVTISATALPPCDWHATLRLSLRPAAAY